ncbi:MAG: hypothetical protein LBQ31_10075 [Bacteroidales bacterium]|nr:hypothetical protein [Bacteroidales bacterium]
MKKLRNSKPIEITGEEITPSEDLKQYKKNALEYGKTLRGKYTNKDTSKSILLGRGKKHGGLNEVLHHDYKDIEHLQSVAAIPQIIEDSIFIDSIANEDKTKNPDIEGYDYYVVGLKINGEDYTVKAVIANGTNVEQYYDHKLTQIEKGKLLDLSAGITSPPTNKDAPLSDYKDKRLISILQTNFSKIIDENGEL